VINECEISSDADVKGVTEAVQTQIHRDLAPVWGVDAELIFVPARGSTAGRLLVDDRPGRNRQPGRARIP
jgi:hypothetical protein